MKPGKVTLIMITIALALCLGSLASGCASAPPFQTWEGESLTPPETALFNYTGTGSLGLVLYAIDGQPRMRDDIHYLAGVYTTRGGNGMCGFSVLLLPGSHRFEFYTVDTNPILIFTIQFTAEAGKTYLLQGKSSSLTLKENGTPVPYTREDVPNLAEPAETQPHATLEFLREDGALKENIYVLRIDGMIRAPMSKRHPCWVVMNYSGFATGLASGLLLVDANVDAAEGTLLVRLAPGKHSIEGFAETMVLGSRSLGDAVRIVDYDFEAGKAYKLVLVKDAEVKEAGNNKGLRENGFAIVPK